MVIGFIGQGYVGKNTANDFDARGYRTVRYSLEEEYVGNKAAIASCDVTFIAVPTPTTPEGFSYTIVEEALSLVGEGKIAVLKSTLLPGTTTALQEKFPQLVILFSPEFLCEATAAHDAAHPIFNIVGYPISDKVHQAAAQVVQDILPKSQRTFLTTAVSAELFKYVHNIQGYMRVILSNIFYDAGERLSVEWTTIEEMMNQDPMMSPFYNSPIHKSGRGAGGHCFIKDMAAFRSLYEQIRIDDIRGIEVLKSMEAKNIELLAETHKDQDLVEGVYGKSEQQVNM